MVILDLSLRSQIAPPILGLAGLQVVFTSVCDLRSSQSFCINFAMALSPDLFPHPNRVFLPVLQGLGGGEHL